MSLTPNLSLLASVELLLPVSRVFSRDVELVELVELLIGTSVVITLLLRNCTDSRGSLW